MKVPMSWFSDYMDMGGISPKEFADAMTMSGSMVEGTESMGDSIVNVVVGELLEVTKHPDADKLRICQLNVGDENIQIVTAAPNITPEKVGKKVPCAKHKSTLADGTKITKGKLRGVESSGMMCSYEELGFTQEDFPDAEYGILILDDDCVPGTDIRDVFGLNETIVEFEITSNRPDCLSVVGLAREAAASFKRDFNIPEVAVKNPIADKTEDVIKVTVEDKEGCPRYMCRGIKNVKIAPSPKWLQDRLRGAGVRPINNIVDITNYVMLEYGQPMHAFDLNYLEGGEIIVRRAKNGEKMVTLDEVERELNDTILVISDKNKAVAAAGIMGAYNSEIKDDTKTVLFESATFAPALTRRGAKQIGLRTEASSRYEKGLDANNAPIALERACQLVEMLGAGEVMSGAVDVNNDTYVATKLPLRADKINKFIGIELTEGEMTEILERIDFKVEDGYVTAPTYRKDIEAEADVAEEIARFYGYDKIPTTVMGGASFGYKTKEQKIEDITKDVLTGSGMYEVATYTFTSPKIFDKLNIAPDSELRNVTRITNPLGDDTSVMRTTTLAEMMDVVVRNISYRTPEGLFFEIGKIYNPITPDVLPDEKNMLTMAIYGQDFDFYSLKGIIEKLFFVLGITNFEFETEKEFASMHPGRCAKVYVNGEEIGYVGQIHPYVNKNYGISEKVYMAELNFDKICSCVNFEATYKALPKYPAMTRDIAVLVKEDVTVSQIEKVIRKSGGKILEDVKLFDVYQGDQVKEGYKSVAYSVSFRADDRTLTDEEVNKSFDKILKNLGNELDAQLR